MAISDELYDAIEKMKYDQEGLPLGPIATQWIHLQDAVDKGSISPAEAYETVALGYVAEHLKVRRSRYEHLL